MPLTRKDTAIKHEGHAPETIHVSDDGGKTYYLTITECTYEELQQVEDFTNISQKGDGC